MRKSPRELPHSQNSTTSHEILELIDEPVVERTPAVVERLSRNTQEILDEIVELPCGCRTDVNDIQFLPHHGLVECHWCEAMFDMFDICDLTTESKPMRGLGAHPMKLARLGSVVIETPGLCGDHHHGRVYANGGVQIESGSAPFEWLRN